ncbi:SDR family oxidoreductase [Bdellovibrio sp. SKB1291214]|uniref:SDR family NAD(P)-dependent oxidoreductase n=1 Tax=Bdellovibrio sp. SKB1291214 TaxID=1732569 RepID=UPI000B51A61D|nr:SDR family oxidoreductase [Bdellovibrio sp. SKB1291214]UYL07258.1 SDR family oxidoreductase [Bdellovibrio sp. SKB1291214]
MNSLTRSLFKRVGLGLLGGITYSLIRDQLRYRSLKNSVVVISGGSRGLGLLLGKEFAQQGASVALLARDTEELARAKKIIELAVPTAEVLVLECDCTKPHQVDQAIGDIMKTFGQIDVVVNNAGIISTAPFENASKKDFEDSLDIHFWAPFYVNRACLPHLKAGARIVNISSIGGMVPVPHHAAYCTGKYALRGYSQSLRLALMKQGIYVTTVCPGLMRTGSARNAKVKGQFKKEHAWFSLMASAPLITINAEKAARRIVSATKTGQAEISVTLMSRVAAIFNTHFPGIYADIGSVANLLLPNPTEDSRTTLDGKNAESFISPSFLTTLGDEAAEKNNEIPPQTDQLH